MKKIDNLVKPPCEDQASTEKPTRLIPLTRWPEYHPWPSLGGLRHLCFYRETNGFDKVVKKCGKRLLIDEHAFFAYIDEINKK